jgi:leader peptidase (prepilin peptidase)/N-methyltransferase
MPPTGTPLVLAALVAGLASGWLVAFLAGRYQSEGGDSHSTTRCAVHNAAFRWFELIPVVSLLLFRGRCRHCGARLSWMPLIVQTSVALVWIVIFWVMGPTLRALMGGVLGSILVGIAVVNARTLLVPNVFTLSGLVIAGAFGLAHGYSGFLIALLGAGVGFGITLMIELLGRRVFREETFGGGIIKMCAMIGAFVGWEGLVVALCLSALLAIPVVGLTSLKRKRLVPFGVFLAVGAAVTFLWGDGILEWYRHFLSGT